MVLNPTEGWFQVLSISTVFFVSQESLFIDVTDLGPSVIMDLYVR